jgi:ribose transport system substrate-binding protein
MPDPTSLGSAPSRRQFFGQLGVLSASLGAVGLLTGCDDGGAGGAASLGSGGADGSGRRRLKALFSNAGLQSTWCSLGKTTAELWGGLLGVEVTWVDGAFDSEKQRNRFDAAVSEAWDFVVVQAVQEDSLAAPVKQLSDRGVPVISLDVDIVKLDPARKNLKLMRDAGVWTHITADQVFMGESSTRYIFEKINGKGKVIHIGGLAAHSGAQGRAAGFDKARAAFPNIEVVGGGVRWCDWQSEKARDVFEALLKQESEPIAGAFFHSDDMALACLPAIRGTVHKDMLITAVDGQKQGLESIRDGGLAASTVNPVCLLHGMGLIIGQFIARNGEKRDDLPYQIIAPGPLVSKESGNLDAMLYLSNPARCMV